MNEVIIVGAGLCGSALARTLSENQQSTTSIILLEKSRGVGGRLAHRRMELAGEPRTTFGFNHGCDCLPGLSTPLWPENWRQFLQNHVDKQSFLKTPATDICKFLLENLHVHRNVQAHNLKIDFSKSLADQEGKRWEFDQLIVTCPAPQAQQLLSAFLSETEKELLSSVRYEKMLICFYQLDEEIKMLKATPEWSEIHFEASTDEIKKAFHRELLKDIPFEKLLDIKKWRFSQTSTPLPQNYLRLENYPWLWIAGDSFAAAAGDGICRALFSGLSTAEAIAKGL